MKWLDHHADVDDGDDADDHVDDNKIYPYEEDGKVNTKTKMTQK